MILLTSTNDQLQFNEGSLAAPSIYIQTDWGDYNGTTVTFGRLNTFINVSGTQVIVPSPAGGVTRKVKAIFCRNASGAIFTGTFRHTDGTTPCDLYQHIFQINEQVHYLEGVGFYVIDLTAGIVGRYLATTVITNPTTTFTTGPNTHTIHIRMVGGGGAGGGCTGNATQAAVAGGGGSGGYAEKTFAAQPNTSYTCGVGTGGTGNSNATGGVGGNTTFTVGAVTVTAFGGAGGIGGVSQGTVTPASVLGGAGGSVSTNGDVNAAGAYGGVGHRPGPVFTASGEDFSGGGGSSELGAGANATNVAGTGNSAAALGYGGGGGGALSNTAGAQTGGAGANGAIVVDEYS